VTFVGVLLPPKSSNLTLLLERYSKERDSFIRQSVHISGDGDDHVSPRPPTIIERHNGAFSPQTHTCQLREQWYVSSLLPCTFSLAAMIKRRFESICWSIFRLPTMLCISNDDDPVLFEDAHSHNSRNGALGSPISMPYLSGFCSRPARATSGPRSTSSVPYCYSRLRKRGSYSRKHAALSSSAVCRELVLA
jgi:hypothetical protein